MRTEDDIRDALLAEADDVPNAADVLSRLHLTAAPPRRRIAPAVAAAAAVLAVVVAAALVTVERSGPGSPPASRPVSTLHCPGGDVDIALFAVVPGVKLGTLQRVDCDGRTANLATPGGIVAGQLTLYAPGRYDPALVTRGKRITIAGHQGYRGTVLRNPGSLHGKLAPQGLAWQYAPNAWAVIVQDPAPSAREFQSIALRVAAAVRPAVPAPLLVPMRAGYLPAGSGLFPISVQGQRPGTIPDDMFRQASWEFDRPGTRCISGAACEPWLAISVDQTFAQQDDGTPVDVAGHPGRLSSSIDPRTGWLLSQLDVRIGAWHVAISSTRQGALPPAELIRIAAGLSFADPNNVGSWFDARTALP